MLKRKDLGTISKYNKKTNSFTKNALVKCTKKKLKKLSFHNFQTLFSPEKVLDEKYYFKLCDVYIYDHIPEEEFTSLTTGMKVRKKVVSFFDEKENNLITCNLLDNLEIFPPIKLLIHRLQSLGDLHAYELSKTLENILRKKNLEKKPRKKSAEVENIFSRPSYRDYLEKTDKLVKQFTYEFPIIFWRHSNFEFQYDFQLIQMGFNYKLIEIMGNDPKNFGIKLLKKGLPELIWVKRDYFQMINHIIRLIFFPNQQEEFPEFFIKTKASYIKTKNQCYYGSKFEEDDYVELSVIEVLNFYEKDYLNIFKTNSSDYVQEKYEIQSNKIRNNEKNRNLFIKDNNFKLETIKWIKECYPNITITILKDEEQGKKLRCGYKNIR